MLSAPRLNCSPSLHNPSCSAEELAALVAATEGCTGSDLSVMCREAAMAPLRELMRAGALAGGGKAVSVRPVTAADFGAAVAKLRAQP